ncbi:hypothetical protein MTO96_002491 [Rhipicephalus appendiculatus]
MRRKASSRCRLRYIADAGSASTRAVHSRQEVLAVAKRLYLEFRVICRVLRRRYDVKVYEEFVIKGNTAVLRCHVPEFVREYVTVTAWLIDETVKISAGFHRGDRYSLFPTGELHVRRVDATDAMSRYQCQTQHRLTGEVVNSPSSRKITVRESFAMSPRIIDSRRQVRTDQGRSAQMPCAAQGNPVPSYQWFRKVRGQALPVLQGGRFLHLDGTLVINQARVAPLLISTKPSTPTLCLSETRFVAIAFSFPA